LLKNLDVAITAHIRACPVMASQAEYLPEPYGLFRDSEFLRM